jgi:glycosyltransferase involved in cell wall biosynthesis
LRIAAISVAPVFSDHVIGGSQKILADVTTGLKRNGHNIEIWCTRTASHSGDFEIGDVPVHPDLKLRGAFPATHQVSPAALAQTSDVLRKAADWADRVYLHADAIYLRHTIEGTTTVRSIHDYTYEEALISTLSLPADTTIVPSEYLKKCIETTVAISGRKSLEPVVTIPNGLHVPESPPYPAFPSEIRAREENDLVLLFPHRPEPTKGIDEAIQISVEVQRLDPSRNVRLLIPAHPFAANLDETNISADEITRIAESRGAGDIVELHRWLSPPEMSGYYAAGDVTLCVGSFIESFGLIPIESVVSGTPAVCSRVGALRQFADIDGVQLVPYGDVQASAEVVIAAASAPPDLLESGISQISTKYSHEAMISGFESVITRFLGSQRTITESNNGRLTLAPWCDIQDDLIYDDYAAAARQYPELTRALNRANGSVLINPLLMSAALDAEVRFAIEQRILIPEFDIT